MRVRPLLVAALIAMAATALTPAIARAAGPDLSITKTDQPNPVTVGDDLRSTIVVQNLGPGAADAVTVDDSLPPNSSFGSASPSGCVQAADTVHCELGTIADGDSVTVVVTVAPLAPGTMQDTATVSTASGDPDGSNNSASAQSEARGSACTVTGTWGNDSLAGTAADDVLCGLGGADSLLGDGGDDVLYGGSGVDTASYASASRPVRANLSKGLATGQGSDALAQVEGLVGSTHDDVLIGGAAANPFQGGGGTDVLQGLGGNDHLDGGPAGDVLVGGDGSDTLAGGGGVDTCIRGSGGGSADCLGRSRPDRNDVRGRFDLSNATSAGAKKLVAKLHTFAQWSLFNMWDQGNFLVFVDTAGDDKPEYYVLVRSIYGTHLLAALYRIHSPKDVHISKVPVSHPTGHTITVTIPLSKLRFDPGRAYYRWQAESEWNGQGCPNTCLDFVDDQGPVPQFRP